MENDMSRQERLDYLRNKIDGRKYKTKEPKIYLNNVGNMIDISFKYIL